jgi:hypothetical protein
MTWHNSETRQARNLDLNKTANFNSEARGKSVCICAISVVAKNGIGFIGVFDLMAPLRRPH